MTYHSPSIWHIICFLLSLQYFCNFKVCFTGLLKFPLVKIPYNFFTLKIFNNITPRYNVLNIFDHRNFFRSTLCVSFCKNIFVFWYSHMLSNFQPKILIIFLNIKVNIAMHPNLGQFHLRLFYDMRCRICQLFHAACWFTHSLIPQSYACKFCSSRFW